MNPTPANDPATAQHRLIDGSPACTCAELFATLDALGLPHTTLAHDPVFTVEQARMLRGRLSGGHSKNLFLRNKKGRMWLLTCDESRTVDLNQLAQLLGAKRFSFASAERLMFYLGVIPGAVTPLAVVNDTANAVQMVIDAKLLNETLLNFHPLNNAMTTQIASHDLMTFLKALNHAPIIVDFDRGVSGAQASVV